MSWGDGGWKQYIRENYWPESKSFGANICAFLPDVKIENSKIIWEGEKVPLNEESEEVKWWDVNDKIPVHIPQNIPCWVDYFMGIAIECSKRSKDANTKVGAVIINRDMHIKATGYNSFPRKMKDHLLPNHRETTHRGGKIKWMRHAEAQALANCEHRPKDCICIVSGQCCRDCIMELWDHGVTEVWMGNHSKPRMIDATQNADLLYFVKDVAMKAYLKTESGWLDLLTDKILVENK